MKKCPVSGMPGGLSAAALAAEADAAQGTGWLCDAAGLLTADEISDRTMRLPPLWKNWLNVYAVTTDDDRGKSATAYADDFDEHSTEQEDGVALLIDMDK